MKSRMHSIDERIDACLDALVMNAKQELDELCAKVMQRIDLFS